MATRITSCCRYNELCYDKHVYAYIIFMGMVFCKKNQYSPSHPPEKSFFSKCHNAKLYWDHENSQKRAMPARF